VVRGRIIAALAGVSALAVAPPAHAQNGFPEYRQAVADQYPTQPPAATGGSSGSARPVRTTGTHRTHRTQRTQHSGGAGTTASVTVRTRSMPAAKGSLPFTGSDLSGLVVLALILIAAGLFTGAVARATRRRRRHAPA
jgi:hypothetical protein